MSEFEYLVSVAGYSIGGDKERSSAGFGAVLRRGTHCVEWSLHLCHATSYQARRRGEAFILDLLKQRMSFQDGARYGQKYPYVWLTRGKDFERAKELAKRAATIPMEHTYQERS